MKYFYSKFFFKIDIFVNKIWSFVVVEFNEFEMKFIWNIVVSISIIIFGFFCSSLLV